MTIMASVRCHGSHRLRDQRPGVLSRRDKILVVLVVLVVLVTIAMASFLLEKCDQREISGTKTELKRVKKKHSESIS